MLKAALPFIKPAKPALKKDDSPVTSDPGSVPSEVLSHLCGVLDSSDVDPIVRSLAQDIIVEGVVIFFPDAKARKEYLLSMIGSILVSVCVCVVCVGVGVRVCEGYGVLGVDV